MCTVSMVGDSFNERWKNQDLTNNNPIFNPIKSGMTPEEKQEFEDLKKEVLIMKDLLIRAKIYDEKNNEPHCEKEEKIALLKKVAELVGVDLKDII